MCAVLIWLQDVLSERERGKRTQWAGPFSDSLASTLVVGSAVSARRAHPRSSRRAPQRKAITREVSQGGIVANPPVPR